MAKNNYFSLTDKSGNKVNGSTKVIKVYKDSAATTLAVNATDVVSNIVSIVEANNPYRLKIESILGGLYYLKADGEAEIFEVELKAGTDYSNQDVQDIETKVDGFLNSKNMNLIPNADLQASKLMDSAVTNYLVPNFWYNNTGGGQAQDISIVKGSDVPNLLDDIAVKIDLKAGQEVYMYSGGMTSSYNILEFGVSRLSGGIWVHCDDWAKLTSINLRARHTTSTSELKIFSTYKAFANWRFYYFENELTNASHTAGYKFFVKFTNTGGSSEDVILHVARPVLIENATIPPVINTLHYNSYSLQTQIDNTNADIDLYQSKLQRFGKNQVSDPLFKDAIVGNDPNGWTFTAGGSGAHFGTHTIVDDVITPFGTKSLKLGVDYVSGSNYADIQSYAFVNREEHFVGNDNFSFLFYLKREDSGIQIHDPYLSFNDGVDGSGAFLGQQFANANGGTSEIIGEIGEWQIIRYNIIVPDGWKDFRYVKIGSRLKGGSSIIGQGFKYAWLTGLTVNFDPEFVQKHFNPNQTEEIENSIQSAVPPIVSAQVTQDLDNRSILSGDKKNFGSRIKRTLIKLMANDDTSDSLPQRLKDDDIRIVHIGDSIVNQGYSQEYVVDGVSGAVDNLDFLGLKDRFKNANFSFVNAGVGGQTAKEFRHHLFSQVIPYDPDLVIVSTWGNDGMNDWTQDADEFARYYEQLIRNIRKHTIADIMICSYSLYPSTYETVANSPGHKILKQIATIYDCEFVDIAKFMYEHGKLEWDIDSDGADLAEWVNQGYYAVGNVHPLTKGKQVMAKAIIQHFPRINEFEQDFFDWNGPLSNIQDRIKRIELIDSLEFLDDEIKLDDTDNWVKSSNNDGIESASALANSEYVEIDFYGRQVDMIYKKMANGAQADILIDGVAPSSICRNTFKYPDALDTNYYPQNNSGNERDAKLRYILHDWKTTERIKITMTGTDNVLSQTFDIEGSVSGVLGSGLSNAVEQKITSGADFILLTPEMWYGRTNNIYGQDEFYIYIENAQALDLIDAGDRYGYEAPIFTVANTLDDTYLLRFAMTGAANYRIDKVSKQDRGTDTIETNVIENFGSGDFLAQFNQNGISISLDELQRIDSIIDSDSVFYYYVNRKYIDSIDTSTAGSVEFRKVTLVSGLEKKNHTLRITKNGTDKLFLSALIVKK